ncbi:MAG: hypothetical protein KF732_09130 [Flavobacteriales bacterium]|nr:hypothetical protein [Flavobacteriales bacterium]
MVYIYPNLGGYIQCYGTYKQVMRYLKMTFALTDKIEKTTDLSQDKVVALLESGTTNKFQLFPDHIMTGEIYDDCIDTVINPPTGFSDPFKSRVTGNITCDNKLTKISLTVKPSWTVVVFTIVWCGLIIKMLYDTFISTDLPLTFKSISLLICLSLIPFGLGKLKVIWDTHRLKEWLDTTIINTA